MSQLELCFLQQEVRAAFEQDIKNNPIARIQDKIDVPCVHLLILPDGKKFCLSAQLS